MRLAAWVYAQADSNGTLPDWDDLFERWNTEFAGPPDWRYAFPSWMKQDLGRAVASLLNASRPPDPEWGPPWPAG